MPVTPPVVPKHAGNPDDPVERRNKHEISHEVEPDPAARRNPIRSPSVRRKCTLAADHSQAFGDFTSAKPRLPPATPAVPHPRRRPRPRSPLAPRRRGHSTPHNSRPCPHPPTPPAFSPTRHPPTLAPRPERVRWRRAAIPLSGAQMHPAAPQEFFGKNSYRAREAPNSAPRSAYTHTPAGVRRGPRRSR